MTDGQGSGCGELDQYHLNLEDIQGSATDHHLVQTARLSAHAQLQQPERKCWIFFKGISRDETGDIKL
eukprot:scaffold12293_cov120-Skeletonema_marinoi.AAC.5